MIEEIVGKLPKTPKMDWFDVVFDGVKFRINEYTETGRLIKEGHPFSISSKGRVKKGRVKKGRNNFLIGDRQPMGKTLYSRYNYSGYNNRYWLYYSG